jgi:ribonuclease HI
MSKLKAYTDGSYVQGCCAWAFVVEDVDGNHVCRYSGQMTDMAADLSQQQNIAAEMKAAVMAAAWAKENEVAITICHDYEGLSKWVSGEWSAGNKWTKRYTRYMRENSFIKGFESVTAHDGIPANEVAHELAESSARDMAAC